jgi:hypothetical protein
LAVTVLTVATKHLVSTWGHYNSNNPQQRPVVATSPNQQNIRHKPYILAAC